MPFACLKALQRIENIYKDHFTNHLSAATSGLETGGHCSGTGKSLGQKRRQGCGTRHTAILLPSCCLAIRLKESKNFKKKDYFWQIMSQQNMFKSKFEAKYFHGEFSSQGLWQGLCFLTRSWRSENPPWHHSLRTSAQHRPPCSTDRLPCWLPCACAACPHKPHGAQSAAAGAAMNKCLVQAWSLNSYWEPGLVLPPLTMSGTWEANRGFRVDTGASQLCELCLA